MEKIKFSSMYGQFGNNEKAMFERELELKTMFMWLTYKIWCKNRGLQQCELKNYEQFIKDYKKFLNK